MVCHSNNQATGVLGGNVRTSECCGGESPNHAVGLRVWDREKHQEVSEGDLADTRWAGEGATASAMIAAARRHGAGHNQLGVVEVVEEADRVHPARLIRA